MKLDKNTEGVRAVALSPDGKLVAGALEDHTIRVWRVADGELVYTLAGHTDWVRCLAFSPDGSILASGSFDMTVRLWNVADGKLLKTLKGHTSSILKVAFSPDGKTLASSSVDETVRLWQVSDGKLLHVLQGYTDFIYALAFSPDGKTLASGGGENALRLWNLDALQLNSGVPADGEDNPVDIQSTTSDCRQCHHRQGQERPPRVIDLSCEGCHAGGIGQTFCAAFPRSATVGPLPIAYSAVDEVSGLPVSGDNISVVIASPGNGETLYVKGNFMAPEQVSGEVFYGDKEAITKVELHLDILSGGQKTASLVAHPTVNGKFTFNVAINPGSPTPQLARPGTKICLVCHGDYLPEAGLPRGEVRLVVTAVTPEGEQASDQRWIRVDPSENVTVPVEVRDDATKAPLPGLSVQAATILYDWRNRFGQGTSDPKGNARLDLEMLSQAPTVYDLTIPPQVYNGQLYTSPQPFYLILKPGNGSYPAITLTAHAQTGQIDGSIMGKAPTAALQGINMWAIQLPAGPIFRTLLTPQAGFTFKTIPVGRYLVVPDPYALAAQGLYATGQDVDLFSSPQANLSISLAQSRSLAGKVTSRDGSSLPFAWVTVGNHGSANTVNPFSGGFMISNLAPASSLFTASAPGYYSQSQRVDPSNKSLDFKLLPRPDMSRLAWGEGQVYIPPETKASVVDQTINLEYGWVWGQGGSARPLAINVGGQAVSVTNGEFALEEPVQGTGWMYMYKGSAQVKFPGDPTPVKVGSGQMIALISGAKPILMEQAVTMALHPALKEAPVQEVIEPSLGARVQNWLVKAGIGAAQLMTFITYILSLVAIIAIPYLVLSSKERRNRPDAQK